MKVYVVFEDLAYEGHNCLGVFAQEKDAIQMALECNLDPKETVEKHEIIY